MLSLQLKSGEYLTIGDDIAVQIFQTGPSFQVAVKAPREVPIVRGEVLERTGERPEGLRTSRPKSPSKRVHSAKNLEAHLLKKEQETDAFRQMWSILDRMDSGSGEVQALRRQLGRVAAAAECRA